MSVPRDRMLDEEELRRSAMANDLAQLESPFAIQADQLPPGATMSPTQPTQMPALTTQGIGALTQQPQGGLAERNRLVAEQRANALREGQQQVRAAEAPQGGIEKFLSSAAAPLAVPLFMLGGPIGIAAAMALGLTSNSYSDARRRRGEEVREQVKERLASMPQPIELQPQMLPAAPGQPEMLRGPQGEQIPLGTTAPELTPEQRAQAEALKAQQAAATRKANADALKAEQEAAALRAWQTNGVLPPGMFIGPDGKPQSLPGGITPALVQERFGTEMKPLRDAARSVRLIETALTQSGGAFDLQAIYGLFKMLDPGSTVREGEVVLSSQASGPAQEVARYFNNIFQQDADPRLISERFTESLSQLVEANKSRIKAETDDVRNRYRTMAEANRIDFSQFDEDPLAVGGDRTTLVPRGTRAAPRGPQPGTYGGAAPTIVIAPYPRD